MKTWGGRFAAVLTTLSVAACGGGGGGGGEHTELPSGGSGQGSPSLRPSSTYAQQCAPTNPFASASLRTGSLTVEKNWLRSYMDEAYLWYDQVPVVNAALPQYSDTANVGASLDAYFRALLTPQRTASGKYVDQFSFAMPTATWQALTLQGTDVGYGVMWNVSYSPNNAVVTAVVPGSAAAQAGVQRGDRLLSVDGSAVESLDAMAFYNAVFPASAGTSHRLTFTRASGGSGPDTVLAAAAIAMPAVPIVQTFASASGTVGYILFNSHDAPSEAALVAAINQLKAADVKDLVLDLRYNGGGYLYIASELAYMIAGPARTQGRVFEKWQYNAKRTADNAQAPAPFFETSCYMDTQFNCTNSQPLPTLGLGRVYVLATGNTCSASEAIVNGLRGIDVDVRLIGGTTCGKPYGFLAKDNCGISYAAMEFKGVNAKGFGDYADGFTPDCAAGDDLSRPLGSADEGLLATALAYRETGNCVPRTSSTTRRALSASGRDSAAVAHSAVRGLRIAVPPAER
jgi:carboxyl-terminal processing protease